MESPSNLVPTSAALFHSPINSTPRGLPNPQNSCYFNSVMQIILNVPGIRELFTKPNLSEDANDRRGPIKQLRQESLSKDSYLDIFNKIAQTINRGDQNPYSIEVQEDVQEFICNIIPWEVAFNPLTKQHVAQNPFLCHVVFQNKCIKCKHEWNPPPVNEFLSLPILASKEDSVKEAICRYQKTEIVEVDCPSCSFKTAQHSITIEQVPDILLFGLKRFKFNESGVSSKIKQSVKLNRTISIGGKSLDLVACIEHIGDSLLAGHYVSRIIIDGTCYLFNDEEVSKCPSILDTRSKESYILVYISNNNSSISNIISSSSNNKNNSSINNNNSSKNEENNINNNIIVSNNMNNNNNENNERDLQLAMERSLQDQSHIPTIAPPTASPSTISPPTISNPMIIESTPSTMTPKKQKAKRKNDEKVRKK